MDNFQIFVRRMYYKNCAERRECGEQPYFEWQEYLEKNENYLKQRYEEQKNKKTEHSGTIVFSPKTN
jgi:hypothetical protein